MKTLNLDKVKNDFNSKSVLDNLETLVSKYGLSFKMKYDGKTVPIIVKRRIDLEKPTYRISIAYAQEVSMQYPTLSTSFVLYDNTMDIAHIDYVHKNGVYSLTGTYIVNLAVTLLKALNVKKIILIDAASIYDDKLKCKLELSPYLLIKKSSTFYGKFGFIPYNPSRTETAYQSNEERLTVLCKRMKEIQKIDISSLLVYLERVEKVLKTAGKGKNLELFFHDKDYNKGIDKIYTYEDFVGKDIEELLSTIEKIRNSLEKYKKMTIFEMMQHCSCREFKSLKIFFEGFPTTVKYKSVTLKHKHQAVFNELMEILFTSDYVLDLSKPIRSSTC